MSDTVIMIDLVGSTQAMADRGIALAGSEIAGRLRGLVQEFMLVDPAMRQMGEFSGDGVLLIGGKPKEVIICALRAQVAWSGLSARIAICVGPVEFREGAGAQGGVINMASRLVDLCPPGGVVVSESAVDYLLDVPGVRGRMTRRRAELKGLGDVTYWVMNGRRRQDWVIRWLLALTIALALMAAVLAWHHVSFMAVARSSGTGFFEVDRPQTFADGSAIERRDVFSPGDTVYVRRNFCVTRDMHVVVHRFLINGEVVSLPARERDLKIGCTVGVVPIMLPQNIAPGAWTGRVILEVAGGETKQLADAPFTVRRR